MRLFIREIMLDYSTVPISPTSQTPYTVPSSCFQSRAHHHCCLQGGFVLENELEQTSRTDTCLLATVGHTSAILTRTEFVNVTTQVERLSSCLADL